MLSDSSQPDIVPLTIAASDQDQTETALAWLTAVGGAFSKDLRRLLPFLARQRARIVIDVARTARDAELRPAAEGPCLLVRMSSPEQVWLALQFDSLAISALLEGLFVTPRTEGDEDGFDGDADADAPSLGDSLTLAQRALLKRLCGDLSVLVKQPVSDVCKAKLAAPEFAIFKRGELPELTDDAIAIDIRIENVRRPWAIRLWMGADALQQLADEESQATAAAPSFGAAVVRIPVTVVAELGRVTLKLSQVLGLRVGDTLRLPSPANDPVLVRVEGVPKFDAVPVISRGQVAVKIHARHHQE